MTGIFAALMISILLLVLLLLVWRRATVAARELPTSLDLASDQQFAEVGACPPEYVAKIFSPDDWHFIEGMKSPLLKELFRRERKAVALLWVQQTAEGIRRIMREHLESARRSHDLEFATEAKIFLQYAQLRFVCGLLFVSIELAGPQGLRGLALHADKLSQRIAQTRQGLAAATEQRQMHRAGSA